MEHSIHMISHHYIMLKFAVLCYFALNLICSFEANANPAINNTNKEHQTKSYTIVFTEIPGFLSSLKTEPGTLINEEILSRIEKRHNIQFKSEFLPVKRAVVHFNKGYADLVFAMTLGDPGLDLTVSQGPNTIDSAPIAGSGYAVFTRKGSKKINSISELKEKNIGTLVGITLPSSFDKKSFKSITVNQNAEQSFKMLKKGRIDALLTIKAVGIDEIARLSIKDIEYGDEFDYIFACYSAHLTPTGAQLIEYINQTIGEVIKDGTYKKIVTDYPGSLLQN